ncbi:MAG: hypothetical protein ACRDL7_12285, partial [Gaiellaceae bacterium]
MLAAATSLPQNIKMSQIESKLFLDMNSLVKPSCFPREHPTMKEDEQQEHYRGTHCLQFPRSGFQVYQRTLGKKRDSIISDAQSPISFTSLPLLMSRRSRQIPIVPKKVPLKLLMHQDYAVALISMAGPTLSFNPVKVSLQNTNRKRSAFDTMSYNGGCIGYEQAIPVKTTKVGRRVPKDFGECKRFGKGRGIAPRQYVPSRARSFVLAPRHHSTRHIDARCEGRKPGVYEAPYKDLRRHSASQNENDREMNLELMNISDRACPPILPTLDMAEDDQPTPQSYRYDCNASGFICRCPDKSHFFQARCHFDNDEDDEQDSQNTDLPFVDNVRMITKSSRDFPVQFMSLPM